MNAIFYNGRIYTGNPEQPEASALAVEGNRIAAVGGDELLSLADEHTRCIDLKGLCVTPGLMDTHMHTAHMSRNLSEAQLAVGWEAHPEDIAPLVHAHPSQGEAFGEAAMLAAGRPLHAHA